MEEPFADPAAMTPHERRQEMAALRARGYLGLKRRSSAEAGSLGGRPGLGKRPRNLLGNPRGWP